MNRESHAGLFHRSLTVIAVALASATVAAAGLVPSEAAAVPGAHRQHSSIVQRPKVTLRHHARPAAAQASARHPSR